jgi:SAM-dependent methyltransferase
VGFVDFVLSQLPRTPSRVLEVGCGQGQLALALADSGHDVTAIDPVAPEGPIFQRVTLEEFASSDGFRFDEGTATWYLAHRDDPRKSLEQCLADWVDEHAGLHGHETMRSAFDRRFRERFFAWLPYLYRYSGVRAERDDEQAEIDAGSINPLGFRYVGTRR